MSKIVIDDLLDETSFLNDANERFQQIQDEFNEKVLYRLNPFPEPNGMFNDLDMQENDILNVGTIDTNTLIIAGIPFDGSVNWGGIGGNLSDQTDLWAELQRIESQNVNSISFAEDRLLHFGLEQITDIDGNVVINYTDRVNSQAFGMVRLNSQAKIPLSLLDLKPVEVIGFFFGDNDCPKPYDGVAIVPCPGTPNDFRNPDDIFGEVFETGHTFVLDFQVGSTGDMDLVNPDDLLGSLLKQNVNSGDAIIYIEAISLGGTPISRKGWRLWKNAVQLNTASGVSYNPAGDLVIDDPNSDNVDLALGDLDIEADRVRTEAADNTSQNIVQDVALVDHEGRITSNTDEILLNDAEIAQNILDIAANTAQIVFNDADILALQNDKVNKTDFAVPGGPAGIIRTEYDAGTNTLTIFTTP